MKYLNDVDSKNCVGQVLKSKNFGLFRVLEYRSRNEVVVEFVETCFVKTSAMKEVRNGSIRDYEKPSVFGVGVTGSKFPVKVDGKVMKEFSVWYEMLRRCYSTVSQKKRQTYIGCSVSENFKRYDYFHDWYSCQVGAYKNFHLDKDLLVKGNKFYSENTCVLVPIEINNALTKTNKSRGNFPIGVHFCKSKKGFVSQINRGSGAQEYLGVFDTPTEAFYEYKKAKEDYLKHLASVWKDEIDIRAYDALMNYKVEITD